MRSVEIRWELARSNVPAPPGIGATPLRFLDPAGERIKMKLIMQKSALKEEFQEVGSVGLVKTHSFPFAQTPEEMVLESGPRLGPITLAYETYGELDAKKQNAILICHALSGDAHVAGYHSKNDPKPGWWNNMVG